jgi:hypothetical protein
VHFGKSPPLSNIARVSLLLPGRVVNHGPAFRTPKAFWHPSFVGRLIFGALENRKMLDLRRPGAVEAVGGGAHAEYLAQAMGSTLHVSNALFQTRVPANEARSAKLQMHIASAVGAFAKRTIRDQKYQLAGLG